MKKSLSKFIIFVVIIGICLPNFILQTEAENSQGAISLTIQKSGLENALFLDFKDAKEIKDLPKPKISFSQEGEIKAEIKSFRIEDSFDEKFKEIEGISIKSVIEDPVVTGINWLKNNQNPEGNWSEDERTEIIDTSAVVSALKYTEETPSSEYQKAIDWFNLTYPENSDYLAEKAISLSEAGQDVSSLTEFLASQMNEQDGGFGYQKD